VIRTFCTLFDKNYLVQGVALYRSLARHARDFRLYALCMDSAAFAMLGNMKSDALIPIHVEDLVTEEVAAVRRRTTHGQFCWVCQPLICRHILDRFAVDMVTYLESDSLFFSDPEVLFAEISPGSVSLSPHNYSSEFAHADVSGKFCTQFNAFRNDPAGRLVLADWIRLCFRYDKSAPRAYPGQTGLDDWPERFEGVVVLRHPGAGVAPWNIRGYRLDSTGRTPTVNGAPVVFYHYHQYGRLKNGAHELGSYPLTRDVVDCFYRPYVAAVREAERAVRAIDSTFIFRREYDDASTFGEALRSFSAPRAAAYLQVLKRKLRGRYNIFPDAYFSEYLAVPPTRDHDTVA
jgi:hypothetical protein